MEKKNVEKKETKDITRRDFMTKSALGMLSLGLLGDQALSKYYPVKALISHLSNFNGAAYMLWKALQVH